MKMNKFFALALVTSLPICKLLAQNDGPPPGGQNDGPPPAHGTNHFGGNRMHRPPMPIVKALDTDGDGVISAAEIANAATSLKTLDTNGDGQLTKDEYMPKPPAPRNGDTNAPAGPPPGEDSGHKHPVPPIIAALDTNGDGVISADEIANAPASLAKLDKNGDGKLTMDEIMPHRPGGQHGQGGGPGPDGGDGQRPPPPEN